ncbi:MAG: DUF5060 domain-containing protein [Sedimentisphaerales bacterium]|nr:DUF5060 domain-containing protein [Sedimentisphaerales bacterium]
MPAGWRFSAFLWVSVCAHGLVLGGIEPTPPWPTPPGQYPGTQAATDTAYYLSTATVEQARIAAGQTAGSEPVPRDEASCPDGVVHVPLWGRFEMAIVHPRAHADPYRDVTLDVTLTRPDSSTVATWGFYDGENTWRIRALADQVGTWRVQARFSDGTGQFAGAFTCVESDRPALLSVCKDNPIWFGYKAGKAALVRCLHVSERFLAESDDPVADAQRRARFLDWARSQGYNALSIGTSALDSGRRTLRAEGGRATLALWNAERHQPDPAAYQRLELALDDVLARRMLVYPACGFFGRDTDFPKDSAQQGLYLRYTLARLGSYPNMIWVVGGPEPSRASDPYLGAEEIERLGRKIKTMDPYGHLLCVPSAAGNDTFRDADWTTCAVIQGPRTANLPRLSRVLLRNRNPSKPLYVQQTLWLGSRRTPDYSLDELRKDAYVLMMSGASVSVADMGGNPSSGLSGTLDVSLAVQARHDTVRRVWDFFETVPFWRMQPRQDLVDNGYCLAEPGRLYLVYLPEPGTVTVDIGEGMYQVKWIDARDTSDVRESGIIEERCALTSPQEEDDWLLSLRRVEIVAGEIRPD